MKEIGSQVDYQVAAPAELRTPNLHERKSLKKECGWKDGDKSGSGSQATDYRKKEERKTDLTHTGLLMEGLQISIVLCLSSPCQVVGDSSDCHPSVSVPGFALGQLVHPRDHHKTSS